METLFNAIDQVFGAEHTTNPPLLLDMSASDAPVIETLPPALLSPAPISETVTTPSTAGVEDGDTFCTGRRRRKQVSAQEELAAAMLLSRTGLESAQSVSSG